MPVIVPLNNAGNRRISVNTFGGGVYRFRSYFSQGCAGMYDGWFVDIGDNVGTTLLRGVRVTPGCPNLLKGQGDAFRDVQLACAVIFGKESAPDALGNGAFLIWFNPGEVNPFNVGDPLIDIPYAQWAFHQDTTNRFFGSEGDGSIRIEGRIQAGAIDSLFVLDANGSMRLRGTVAAGTSNDFMTIDENGSVRLKG